VDIHAYLDQQRQRVDRFLEQSLPDTLGDPQKLYESMRYSLLGGGKRVRPILTIAAAQALGYDDDVAICCLAGICPYLFVDS